MELLDELVEVLQLPVATQLGCKADADAAGPGDAEGSLPVLADFEDRDVDDDFAARLVEVVDELAARAEARRACRA